MRVTRDCNAPRAASTARTTSAATASTAQPLRAIIVFIVATGILRRELSGQCVASKAVARPSVFGGGGRALSSQLGELDLARKLKLSNLTSIDTFPEQRSANLKRTFTACTAVAMLSWGSGGCGTIWLIRVPYH